MFRRGGSTGEGITSGLRRGYSSGRGVSDPGGDSPQYYPPRKESSGSDFNLSEYMSEAPELPKSQSRSDFLINFGLDLATRSPQGNILQTAAASAREPFKQFQQQAGQEDLLKYKHAQGERQFQLEIYKSLSDKDKIALQEKIDYLMDEFGLSKEEALNKALPDFRKPRHPDEQKLLDSEYERDQRDKEIALIQSGLSKENEYITEQQAAKIHKFYQQAEDQGWRYEADAPFIDLASIQEEWRAAGKKQEDWVSAEGNIAISPDQQSDYTEGLYYVDSFTGDVYQVGVGSTELIKIDLSEIKIN
jgi:hypothetical protein